MDQLKIHHVIVLVSLFVSLIGTLIILDKMNAAAEPIPTAKVVSVVHPEPETIIDVEEQVEVHVANNTED